MGKKKTKSRVVTKKVTPYSAEQQAILKVLGQTVESALRGPAPSYPGKVVPAWQPEETKYLSSLSAYSDFARKRAEDILAAQQELTDIVRQLPPDTEQIRTGLESAANIPAETGERLWQEYRAATGDLRRFERVPYDYSRDAAEEFYRQTVEAPLMRAFKQDILPKIRAAYAGPTFWSSFRARAEQQAAEDLMSKLAQERARILWEDELARRSALERALSRGLQAERIRSAELSTIARALPYTSAQEAELRAESVTAPEQYRQQALARAIEGLTRAGRTAAEATSVYSEAPTAAAEAAKYRRAVESQILQEGLQRWLMGEQIAGTYNPLYSPAVDIALRLLGYPLYTILAGKETVRKGGLFGGFVSGLSGGLGTALGTAIGKKIPV